MRASRVVLIASLLCAAAITLPSCVRSIGDDIEIQPDIARDHEYSTALSQATTRAKVYNDFENKFQITATYLSPEFRAALAKRYEMLYKEPQPLLEEATAKAGFFVSVYSTTKELNNLTDQGLWNIYLHADKDTLKPAVIRKLSDKERWRPFFNSINVWSNEYLLIFDTPSRTPNSPNMVEKNTIHLTFANADATVSLSW